MIVIYGCGLKSCQTPANRAAIQQQAKHGIFTAYLLLTLPYIEQSFYFVQFYIPIQAPPSRAALELAEFNKIEILIQSARQSRRLIPHIPKASAINFTHTHILSVAVTTFTASSSDASGL